MKTVFNNNSEVVYEFINNNDKSRFGRSSRIFFEGENLYSYGRHHILGRWFYVNEQKVLFLNTNKVSVTTYKHLSILRQQLNCLTFEVPFYSNKYFELNQLDKVVGLLKEVASEAIKKQFRARVNKYHINRAFESLLIINKLSELFSNVERINMYNFEDYGRAELFALNLHTKNKK